MDVLSDVLRALRLRGTAYFHGRFHAPWGMSIGPHDVANFHLVVAGECTVTWEGGATPARLGAGDMAVFPHGTTHALRDEPDTAAPEASRLLATRRPTPGGGTVDFGGEGRVTEIVCGHFELDRAGGHPLLRALPEVVLLGRGEGTDPEWVSTATRLAVLESESQAAGADVVVDRLAEALMIQIVRAHAHRSARADGFLAALGDPALAAALELMHAQPQRAWSVDLLAHEVAVSRSAFAARFKAVLGTTPMQYLTDWRMHRARELLRAQDLSLGEVAERVGYRSEFAFAKAFKRVFGTGPGAARKLG